MPLCNITHHHQLSTSNKLCVDVRSSRALVISSRFRAVDTSVKNLAMKFYYKDVGTT